MNKKKINFPRFIFNIIAGVDQKLEKTYGIRAASDDTKKK